ncbi:MAG: type II toxin-antitoxin system VapC family toxin [Verrucomicrobia bacterium]|nr:type II toxin-antitoxin system VapC family toxin [Verrucomicrobiota bacterium]
MRAYADSSFLVKLIAREPGTEAAVAQYRRLELPRLYFLPLHALEVENAVRQRAFHQRRASPSGQRAQIARGKTAALARLERMLERGAFLAVAADWDDATRRARALSERHTERTGARAFDLLHVAFALELECEAFLTGDERQGVVAKAESLEVILVSEPD